MSRPPITIKARRCGPTEPHAPTDPVAQLVGFGFRGCLRTIRDRDREAGAGVWRRYCGVMGAIQAHCVLAELEAWTDSVYRSAERAIRLECMRCPQLSRDERLAVSVVAAAQHGTCPAMRACAVALMETSHVNPMLAQAERVAGVLADTEHLLAPWSIAIDRVPGRGAPLH